MTRCLIMWSGGIDSTYTLAWLLKNTNWEIYAHHIRFINYEGRARAEEQAIHMLIPELKKIRDFAAMAPSGIDHTGMPGIPFDMSFVCYTAGVLSKGFVENEQLLPLDIWTIGTHEAEGHDWKRWKVIKGAIAAGAYPHKPAKFELMPLVSKAEEMTFLKELGILEKCWFCRRPVMGEKAMEPCGKCKTCHEVINARRNTAIAA